MLVNDGSSLTRWWMTNSNRELRTDACGMHSKAQPALARLCDVIVINSNDA